MSRVDWANDARFAIESYDADVRATGFGDVWGCIGAVATYMRETNLRASP